MEGGLGWLTDRSRHFTKFTYECRAQGLTEREMAVRLKQ